MKQLFSILMALCFAIPCRAQTGQKQPSSDDTLDFDQVYNLIIIRGDLVHGIMGDSSKGDYFCRIDTLSAFAYTDDSSRNMDAIYVRQGALFFAVQRDGTVLAAPRGPGCSQKQYEARLDDMITMISRWVRKQE